MCEIVIKSQLEAEIEQLRKQLNEQWKQHHLLTHPSIILISQALDMKINEYQRLVNEVNLKKI